jgi:hypothetical protein
MAAMTFRIGRHEFDHVTYDPDRIETSAQELGPLLAAGA